MENINIETLERLVIYLDSKDYHKNDEMYFPWYIQAIEEINNLITLLK